jgi:hypothetical protein
MSIHNAFATRPPAYTQLLVDSLDRYETSAPSIDASGLYCIPTSSSNWQLYLRNNVLNGLFTRLAVTQINFQWNIPTILAGYNDALQILLINGGGADIYANLLIAEGWYTPSGLASAIQASLTTTVGAYGTWTCSFTTKNVFSITFAPSGTMVGWQFVAPIGNLANDIRQRRCRETCGFSNFPTPLSGITLTQVFDIPSMLPTRFIDVVSSYLTKYQRSKDNTSLPNARVTNVIARIYPQAPNTNTYLSANSSVGSQPFNLLIDYNTPKYITWSPEESIASIDFQLVDDLGGQLPGFNFTPISVINPNCEYQMTIYASEN